MSIEKGSMENLGWESGPEKLENDLCQMPHNYGLDRAKQKGNFDFSQNLIITPSGDFKQVSEES